ncbi:MAG: hypothetical protein HRT63_04440, partial [Erythrobacter sp.]|nr:hypothetical protein [Erythrobacter sp.]
MHARRHGAAAITDKRRRRGNPCAAFFMPPAITKACTLKALFTIIMQVESSEAIWAILMYSYKRTDFVSVDAGLEAAIIVPIFNEVENVGPLTERLKSVLCKIDFEIIFV